MVTASPLMSSTQASAMAEQVNAPAAITLAATRRTRARHALGALRLNAPSDAFPTMVAAYA
jgi:hypothetical protein